MIQSASSNRPATSSRFVIWAALAAAALILGASLAAKQFERGSAPRIALAVLQGLASASAVILPVRSIRALDEMQQRIQLEALAFAFAGTGVLTTMYGFLTNAGTPAIDWGTYVWPLMVLLWVVGVILAHRRYR
jgi:hypothetical protein